MVILWHDPFQLVYHNIFSLGDGTVYPAVCSVEETGGKLAYRWESCAISINFFVTIHVLMLQSRHTTLSTLFLYVVYGRQDKPASSHQTYHCFEHPATTCFVQSMLAEIQMINMHWSLVSNQQTPHILLSTLYSTFPSHKIYKFYSIFLPFLEDSTSFSYAFSLSSISRLSFSALSLSCFSFCSCALWPQSTTDITATISHLKWSREKVAKGSLY